MVKKKKLLLILLGSLLLLFILIILFISPLTKYLIEKYDMEFSGRQITVDYAYVNPFTGYIYFNGPVIYELNSDSIFFEAKSIAVNFALLKLFSGTYEITGVVLNHPRGFIIQKDSSLNFNDLIKKFSPKDTIKTERGPVHFNISGIRILNGEFHFTDLITPVNYFIKNVDIESGGKQWDSDTITSQFAFSQGTGSGEMKGNFTINLKNKDYRLNVLISKFDLVIIEQYLKDLTNYGSFSAMLDADIKSSGNLIEVNDVTTSGFLNLSDFHFGKNPKEDYASFESLVVAITEMSPKNQIFSFDSIALTRPYFKYERYDYLDNIQTIFGEGGSNIAAVKSSKFNLILEIADYIKALTRNFFQSQYKINRLAIYHSDIKFNDYSVSEKFSAELNPLTIISDSIDKSHSRVNVTLTSGIKPYGDVSVELSINPKDSSDFDLQYHLGTIPATMFNPYLISLTSFPLNRGTIELKGNWKVRNGAIQSKNHLIIIDPRIAKRKKNDDLKWFPMKPVMTLINERGNVIDYEIPIAGNLKDPKFKLGDVILDILENIFVKPVATTYIMQVNNIENEIEKALTLTWNMHDKDLIPEQERFVKKMADFLDKNSGASITVYPNNYALREMEYILLFEAKKKYYMEIKKINPQTFDQKDSIEVELMSMRDSGFVNYVDALVEDSLLFTIQDKSARIIDKAVINARFAQLNLERERVFMNYFSKDGVTKQVQFATPENGIPYNGFSFYRIEYKGELPENLVKAYRRIEQFNSKSPRRKFRDDRKKIKDDV